MEIKTRTRKYKERYEREVKEIKELNRQSIPSSASEEKLRKYNETRARIRALSCEHLTNTGEDMGLRELSTIFYYKDMKGPCLDTLGEEADENSESEEKFEKWQEDSKIPLDRLYKCALTGDYCIARRTGYHPSSISSGDYHYAFVEIDKQQRCPGFESKEKDDTTD